MIKIILFFTFSLFTKNLFATNIAVIDIEELINENSSYIEIIKKMDQNQEIFLSNFNETEKKLDQLREDIETSKLLLEESELNKMISNYNKEINDFQKLVDSFNTHYQEQILNIRKSIIEKIIPLIKILIREKKIDIVLDSTSYLIASNSINITDDVRYKLKDINLKLEYKDFEN